MEDFDYEEMEMPTPCIHCGEIFDLNDGYGSEKWHPNVVICENCHSKEEAEIEEDERWEDINIEIGNALYELKEQGAWEKLSNDNKELIIQIAIGLLPIETRVILRKLVDKTWNMATESTEVPATKHADDLIDATISEMLKP